MEFPLTPRWSHNRLLGNWFDEWFDGEDWLPLKTKYSGLTVSEDTNKLYVQAALPGVDPDKIEVTFEKGTLSIRGNVEEEEKDEKRYYRKASQSFAYRVDLPGTVITSQEPDVSYRDGVLYVTFEKSKELSPTKKIAIKRG